MSSYRADASSPAEQLPPGAPAAPAAADIAASELGPAWHARLADAERKLYWIPRRFATTGRPSSADRRGEAVGKADFDNVLEEA